MIEKIKVCHGVGGGEENFLRILMNSNKDTWLGLMAGSDQTGTGIKGGSHLDSSMPQIVS